VADTVFWVIDRMFWAVTWVFWVLARLLLWCCRCYVAVFGWLLCCSVVPRVFCVVFRCLRCSGWLLRCSKLLLMHSG